jgi:hypothetical protein
MVFPVVTTVAFFSQVAKGTHPCLPALVYSCWHVVLPGGLRLPEFPLITFIVPNYVILCIHLNYNIWIFGSEFNLIYVRHHKICDLTLLWCITGVLFWVRDDL